MKFLAKGISVLAGVAALGSVMVGTASAGTVGTEDFFKCPVTPKVVQTFWTVSDWQGSRSVFLERCWSSARNDYMFRGNVQQPKSGDVLRIAYHSTGGWVENSYRSAPHDVDADGYMPGEWYLAGGGLQGYEIEACVNPSNNPDYTICTQT